MTAPKLPTATTVTTSSTSVTEVSCLDKLSDGRMATATATPVTATTLRAVKRRIIFADDPISDIFIVNRVDTKYNLELFYQPEDFARFRHERNMELMEQNARRRQYPKRDSMDLRKSNLNNGGDAPEQQRPMTRRGSNDDSSVPCRITRPTNRCSMDLTRSNVSLSPRPAQSSRVRPMRPCSRSGAGGRRVPTTSSGRTGRPTALAA